MTPLLLVSIIASVGAAVGLIRAILEERSKRKACSRVPAPSIRLVTAVRKRSH
jgi:hypothetical protein